MRKQYYLMLFFLLAIAQLWVAGSTIFRQEQILKKGRAYRFKTAPVDPTDPFRGKYITLRFEAERYETRDSSGWANGARAFVYPYTDGEGFAQIDRLSKTPPQDNEVDYFEARVDYFSYYDDYGIVDLRFPFDRFYMEETKAPEAEKAYRQALNEENQTIYALVYVKNGECVLEDVKIGERSIREVVD